MIYILLEQEGNVINSVEQDFLKRYHKTSIKRYASDDVDKSELSTLQSPPLFDSNWLVVCTSARRWLSKCYPEKNTILIKVSRKSSLQQVLQSIPDIEYKVIDNYSVPKDLVISWIMKNLRVTDYVAKRLYNRAAGRLKEIAVAVDLLKTLPSVNLDAVNTYTNKVNRVGIFDLVQYLLGISEDVSPTEMVQFIYDFRYAISWVLNSVTAELQLYFDVYMAMDTGELSLTNFRDFIGSTDIQSVRVCKPYRIQKIIESHDVVSTELVYFLILQIKSMPTGKSGVEQLLQLMKIGGNNVYSM